MKIGFCKDQHSDETRTPIIPPDLGKLVSQGLVIHCESGVGQGIYEDDAYTKVGATIIPNRNMLLSEVDLACQIRKPSESDITQLKKDAIWVSMLDPFNEAPLLNTLAKQNVRAVSLEMIPRITRAQKMDVLSSQASLAGYAAVICAAEHQQKVFPMMMTPAGTISPCRVFVIGAGVAGLQAIATAKRLGARVEAFDTRPVVEEQVQSLGAKFVKVDLGDTGQTKDGYAKQLTEEQLNKQKEVMAKHCALADVVITTAQVFGKKAPLIITGDMIKNMSQGSVIVDLAVETGGNVEGSKCGETILAHGKVHIVGKANLPAQVKFHASQMLSANIFHFISEFWDQEARTFNCDPEDEILKGCLLTKGGDIIHPLFSKESQNG